MAKIANGKARTALPQSWVDIPDRGYLEAHYPNKKDVSTEINKQATNIIGQEVPKAVQPIDAKVDNVINGTTKVTNAKNADNATNATNADNANTHLSQILDATTNINTYYGEKYWGKNYSMYGSASANPSLPNGLSDYTACGISILRCNVNTLQVITSLYNEIFTRIIRKNGDLDEWRKLATTNGTIKGIFTDEKDAYTSINDFTDFGTWWTGGNTISDTPDGSDGRYCTIKNEYSAKPSVYPTWMRQTFINGVTGKYFIREKQFDSWLDWKEIATTDGFVEMSSKYLLSGQNLPQKNNIDKFYGDDYYGRQFAGSSNFIGTFPWKGKAGFNLRIIQGTGYYTWQEITSDGGNTLNGAGKWVRAIYNADGTVRPWTKLITENVTTLQSYNQGITKEV